MTTLKHTAPLRVAPFLAPIDSPTSSIYTLELHGGCHKARICRNGEFLIGLSISLKYYYDRREGFVERKQRTLNECLILAQKWARVQGFQ